MQTRRNARATIISLALAIAIACLVTGERDARAQSAQAEALFQKGNWLMLRGRIAEACEAYDASNRLDPGAGVLLNLGDCREKNGQLASAWAAYTAALSRAKSPKKRDDAVAKIASITPRLSYLTVAISDDGDIEGLSLTSDGTPLDPKQWKAPGLPIDGGDYVIACSAPGREPWQVVAHVPREGGHVTVDVPKLKPLSRPAVSSTVSQQPEDAKPGEPSKPGSLSPPALAPRRAAPSEPVAELAGHEPAQSTGTFTTTRKIAVGVAGASVIGIAAGVALLVSAHNKQDDAFDRCPDPETPCSQAAQAQALLAWGQRRVLEANIALGIGAAAAVGAGVLWFAGAPDGEASRRVSIVPRAAPGEIGIVVLGRF